MQIRTTAKFSKFASGFSEEKPRGETSQTQPLPQLNNQTLLIKMNNPSPLVPQGLSVDQKNKGRARVKIAVFFVLAVHGVGLLALLLQGCHREDSSTQAGQTTNAPPAFDATNLPAVAEPTPPAGPSNKVATAEATAPAPTAATEYTAASRDTYHTIAT